MNIRQDDSDEWLIYFYMIEEYDAKKKEISLK